MATGGADPRLTCEQAPDSLRNCSVCTESGDTREAFCYCQDCDRCLCESCLRDHNKFLKQHTTIGRKQLSDWTKLKPRRKLEQECEKHAGSPISMYCGRHDVVCCPVCAALEHGYECHGLISYIPAITEGLVSSRRYQGVLDYIDHIISGFTELDKTAKEVKAKSICTIKDFKENVIKLLADLEVKSISYINEFEKKGEDDNPTAHVQELNSIRQKFVNMEMSDAIEKFIAIKSSLRQIRQHESCLFEQAKHFSDKEIQFSIDDNVQNALGSLEKALSFGILHRPDLDKNVRSSTSTENGEQTLGTTVKFKPVLLWNEVPHSRFQVISAMKEYETKSMEELRFEDYQSNRKGQPPVTWAGFDKNDFLTSSSSSFSSGFNAVEPLTVASTEKAVSMGGEVSSADTAASVREINLTSKNDKGKEEQKSALDTPAFTIGSFSSNEEDNEDCSHPRQHGIQPTRPDEQTEGFQFSMSPVAELDKPQPEARLGGGFNFSLNTVPGMQTKASPVKPLEVTSHHRSPKVTDDCLYLTKAGDDPYIQIKTVVPLNTKVELEESDENDHEDGDYEDDAALKEEASPTSDDNKPCHWYKAGYQLFGGEARGKEKSHFNPIVPLPALIEVKTGEEDETKEFCQRAKLFRFDVEKKEWKEKGVGEMKILKHKVTGKYRFLLRREQVHKLACNHLLTPDLNMKPMSTSETAWCWLAQDYSESELKVEKMAVRFKNIEHAKSFKVKVDEIQALLRDSASRMSYMRITF